MADAASEAGKISESDIKKVVAEAQKRIAVLKAIDKEVDKIIAEGEKEKSEFSGLSEAYEKIMKLAHVKPDTKCIAAIKKAEAAPSRVTIVIAKKEIEAHVASLLKAGGKSKEMQDLKANATSLGQEILTVLDAEGD